MKQTPNFQNVILSELKNKKIPMTLFLMNGFQLKGTIIAFDNFVVVIESEGKQQMTYKHAISTIVPSKPFPIKAIEN